MFEALIKLAIPIASIYDKKQDTKYVDRILKIKKELHDEELKQKPDDGRISYLHIELMRITDILANAVVTKKVEI